MEKVTSAVWQPPADGPVGRDFDVRRALSQLREFSDRLARAWAGLVFLTLVCLLAGLWVSGCLAALAVVVTGVRVFRVWLRSGRHLGAVERLLATEPARLLDVTYLGGRVIRLGDTVARLPVLPAGARDRLWLVGPDPAGRAVVFADAMAHPRFGQVLPQAPDQPHPERAARPRDPVGAARSAARAASQRFARRWVFTLIITISIGTELAPQPQVLGWLYAIAGLLIVVLASREWSRITPSIHAAGLLRTPLADLPARLTSERSVAVTLSDGSELAGKLMWSTNLVANVRASGRLWVAGTPAPGATLGVGVPDFPISGVVRFN